MSRQTENAAASSARGAWREHMRGCALDRAREDDRKPLPGQLELYGDVLP